MKFTTHNKTGKIATCSIALKSVVFLTPIVPRTKKSWGECIVVRNHTRIPSLRSVWAPDKKQTNPTPLANTLTQPRPRPADRGQVHLNSRDLASNPPKLSLPMLQCSTSTSPTTIMTWRLIVRRGATSCSGNRAFCAECTKERERAVEMCTTSRAFR
jgi:hypothetical protein